MARRVSQRGKYLVSDRFAVLVLRLIDFLTSLQFVKKRPFSFNNAKRVLICNTAHLGDVLLSTSVIGFLSEHYPHMEIGFLCSSTSKVILNNHPAIKYLHFFDHYKLNRSNQHFLTKLKTHKNTYKKAAVEITSLNYDCAVDLYPFFPNAIPLLKRAKIAHRIGYTSGGFGPLLTQPFDFEWEKKSMASYFMDLIHPFCDESLPSKVAYFIPKPLEKNVEVASKNYVVFHVGTPNPKKRWPQSKWIELTRLTASLGLDVLFTGRGKEDSQLISEIVNASGGKNLCDQLNIEELKSILMHSKGVVSVDTMTAHLSSAFQIPTLVFHTGMHEKTHWAPLSLHSEILTLSLPCSPCMDAAGCPKMSCIQGVESSAVFEKLKRWVAC